MTQLINCLKFYISLKFSNNVLYIYIYKGVNLHIVEWKNRTLQLHQPKV